MVFLILFFFITEIHASEWWDAPRGEDETYIYYMASDEGDSNLTRLYERATNKAISNLIREKFGMQFKVSEDSVSGIEQDSIQIVNKQSSDQIFIKGIVLFRQYHLEIDDGQRVYVQIRATKSELARAMRMDDSRDAPLNQYGEVGQNSVEFRVRTYPKGALIHLSHKAKKFSIHGQGDALFNLPIGSYHLVITLEGHEVIEKEIEILSPLLEEKIKLKPLMGILDLKITPSDVRIKINGQDKDNRRHEFQVGKAYFIELEHEDYFREQFELQINSDETISRSINMKPRPSTLMFHISPKDAVILIDGEEAKSINGKISVSPGAHNIEVTRSGYATYNETLDIYPNRDYPLKIIRLKQAEKLQKPIGQYSSNHHFRIEYNPFLVTQGVGYLSVTNLGLYWEKSFISLGGQISYLHTEDSSDSGGDGKTLDLTDYFFSLRIHGPDLGNLNFYGSGLMGKLYKQIGKIDKYTDESYTYQGYGIGARYYFSQSWSFQTDLFQIHSHSLHSGQTRSELKGQVGIGFDF